MGFEWKHGLACALTAVAVARADSLAVTPATAPATNAATNAASNPPELPGEIVQGWSEIPAPGSFYLLMVKNQNKLSVRSLYDEQKSYRSYRAISGTNSGDKEREGDMKTPEGIYFIEGRVPKSRMRKLHGSAAFELNYPNAVDHIFKRTGHGIWIHGVESESRMEKRFDTLGCVALGNQDILDLGEHLTFKNIPIVIVDNEDPARPIGVESAGGPLHQRVEAWVKAWSSKDADAYLAFYSPDFYARHMNFEQWSKYKRRLARTYKHIDVKINDLKILRHGKYSVAIFQQEYTSNLYKSTSLKRLYLVGEGASAQILAEEAAQDHAAVIEESAPVASAAPASITTLSSPAASTPAVDAAQVGQHSSQASPAMAQ